MNSEEMVQALEIGPAHPVKTLDVRTPAGKAFTLRARYDRVFGAVALLDCLVDGKLTHTHKGMLMTKAQKLEWFQNLQVVADPNPIF